MGKIKKGMTKLEITKAFSKLDKDHNGRITFDGF